MVRRVRREVQTPKWAREIIADVSVPDLYQTIDGKKKYAGQAFYTAYKVKAVRYSEDLQYLKDAYNEVSQRICEAIVDEYKEYIQAGIAPGNPTPLNAKSNYPALSRGEASELSLINALQVVREPAGHFGIYVVNKVWLYQEFGFDMHGKMPPLPVAMKILDWAVQKGIVFVKTHLMEATVEGRTIQWKAIQGKQRQEIKPYRLGKPRTNPAYHGQWSQLTKEDVELIRFTGGKMSKKLNQIMWKITKAVVTNSKGRYNRRLFLTCAKMNVFSDIDRIRKIEFAVLGEYGFKKFSWEERVSLFGRRATDEGMGKERDASEKREHTSARRSLNRLWPHQDTK